MVLRLLIAGERSTVVSNDYEPVQSLREPNKRLSDFPISMMMGQMAIECQKCFQRFQCNRFLPYFDATLIKYCVVCGGKNIAFLPWKDDKAKEIETLGVDLFWSHIGTRLGIKRESAIMLYEIWSPVNGDDLNFFKWAEVQIVLIRAAAAERQSNLG